MGVFFRERVTKPGPRCRRGGGTSRFDPFGPTGTPIGGSFWGSFCFGAGRVTVLVPNGTRRPLPEVTVTGTENKKNTNKYGFRLLFSPMADRSNRTCIRFFHTMDWPSDHVDFVRSSNARASFEIVAEQSEWHGQRVRC